MRLFAFGLGYSARATVLRMRPRLEAVWGTTRDQAKFGEIEGLGVSPILFGSTAPVQAASAPLWGEAESARSAEPGLRRAEAASAAQAGEGAASDTDVPSPHPFGSRRVGLFLEGRGEALSAALAQADHVLVSIAPDESGDPVLARYRNELAALKPRSVVYLSTVGVYGDHRGAWVDEASECRPVSKRSQHRVEAEARWRAFAAETCVPVAVVRLAGIYGPGRGPFEKIRRGTARRVIKPGQVFNRIHAEDIAAIVEAALLQRADGVFNGADDEPAPPQDVLAYAAELLGVPPPPEMAFEDAEFTPMARTFYGENKRVRNERIKRDLGIQLAYPTYREGLAAVLRAEARQPSMP